MYRTGSKKITTSNKDFGTIAADIKTKSLVLNGNGTENGTNINLTYGQTASVGVLSRSGYNFLGWNTNAEGTGETYGNSDGASLSVEQVNAILDDASITAFYAMWQADINTVIAFIDAIPDPVVYTQECKDKIDAARTLYDSLDTADKALVTNYDDLTDAESIYNGMQSDKEALDAYKTEKKTDADDLALEGDSAACTDLISDAKDAIDALSYDCTKSLDENKAAVDKIIADLADALALQRNKEAFEAYKVPSKEAADALALESDSAACETLIANAKDAIDALNYDEEKTLDENKAIIDGIIADLADALALQRNKEAFEAYKVPSKEAADALALESDSAACETLIANAKDAIDALNYDEEKTLDENKAIIDGIIDALEDDLGAQRDNEAAAADVEALIDAIPDPVTYPDSKGAIDAAKDAFDALTEEQQALVDDEHKDALADAEAAYKPLEDVAKANAAKALIEAIGEVEDTQDSKNAIDAAREAYDALTDDQKALITEDAPTIVTAEATYTTLHANNFAAAEVVALINAIGTVEYTETSKNKIDTAKEAYNDLTDAQKAIVDGYLTENEVDTIVVSETIYIGLGDQQKALEVKDLIVAIGKVKYPDSKDKIEAARGSYDALTDTQKALVDNYSVLTTAEATYAELEAKSNKKLSGGAIAGIVIGCVAFVAIVCFLLWFFLFKKKKEDKDEPKVAVPETNDEPKNDQTDEPKE